MHWLPFDKKSPRYEGAKSCYALQVSSIFSQLNWKSFKFSNVDTNTVMKKQTKLNIKKATGYDGLSTKLTAYRYYCN